MIGTIHRPRDAATHKMMEAYRGAGASASIHTSPHTKITQVPTGVLRVPYEQDLHAGAQSASHTRANARNKGEAHTGGEGEHPHEPVLERVRVPELREPQAVPGLVARAPERAERRDRDAVRRDEQHWGDACGVRGSARGTGGQRGTGGGEGRRQRRTGADAGDVCGEVVVPLRVEVAEA